jgi:hypothetical protein
MYSTLQLQKSQNFLEGARGEHWPLPVFVSFDSVVYHCHFNIQIGVPNWIIFPIPIHYLESFLPPKHILTFGCPQKYSSQRWIVEIELHSSLEALLINRWLVEMNWHTSLQNFENFNRHCIADAELFWTWFGDKSLGVKTTYFGARNPKPYAWILGCKCLHLPHLSIPTFILTSDQAPLSDRFFI